MLAGMNERIGTADQRRQCTCILLIGQAADATRGRDPATATDRSRRAPGLGTSELKRLHEKAQIVGTILAHFSFLVIWIQIQMDESHDPVT